MATYVADAYNASAPTTGDVAGHADKEIRAIKERLNSQIGLATVTNLGYRLQTAEQTVTTQGQSIASISTRLGTAEQTIINQGQTISSQGSSISSNTQAINGMNSTVTSQGQAITSQGNRLTTAEGTISSHTASINSMGSRLTNTEGVANGCNSWIVNTGQPTLNALNARGVITGITSYPANSLGNNGDLLVWYI